MRREFGAVFVAGLACGLAGGLPGATAGLISAVAVDAAVFAYGDAPEPQAASLSLRIGLKPRGGVVFGTF